MIKADEIRKHLPSTATVDVIDQPHGTVVSIKCAGCNQYSMFVSRRNIPSFDAKQTATYAMNYKD
jgi:hypothetical protein